jgi:hypothetical protein
MIEIFFLIVVDTGKFKVSCLHLAKDRKTREYRIQRATLNLLSGIHSSNN